MIKARVILRGYYMSLINNHSKQNQVTVLIPVWNSIDDIEVCLESVLGQTYQDLKIVVSDNFSNDGTRELLKKKYGKHPKISLVLQSQNIGAEKNFLALSSFIDTDYFMFLGSDDCINPDFIRNGMALLTLRSDIQMITPRVVYSCGNSNFAGRDENVHGDTANVRIINYLSRVQDNGGFYHLGSSKFAQSHLRQCLELPSFTGFDHCYMVMRYASFNAIQEPNCIVTRKLGEGSDIFGTSPKNLRYCWSVFRNSIEYLNNVSLILRTIRNNGIVSRFSFISCIVVLVVFHGIKRNLGVFGSIYIKKPLCHFRRMY